MAKQKVKRVMIAKCQFHPRYNAQRKPKSTCLSCWLLYIMHWQGVTNGEFKLGSLNPYSRFTSQNFEDACCSISIKPTETA